MILIYNTDMGDLNKGAGSFNLWCHVPNIRVARELIKRKRAKGETITETKLIRQPDVPLVGSINADTVIVVDGDIDTLEM